MELDELKSLWKEAARRLDVMEPALRLNQRLAMTDRMRSRLWAVRLVLWYEVSVAALVLLLTGSYLVTNIHATRFALPAVMLHAGAILMLAFAVRQLVALGRVEYAGPVVEMQRALATCRVVRAQSNRWLLLSTPFIWAVLIIIVPQSLIGLDVYLAFGPLWVFGNFVVAIAVLAMAAWASRRLPAASRSAAFLRALGEDVTGHRVAEACAFLNDIAAFEECG